MVGGRGARRSRVVVSAADPPVDSVWAMATDRRWRPFWLHQGAEYLVALVLIASALQSPHPFWPAFGGGLVLVNAAFSGPPLGAFRLLDGRCTDASTSWSSGCWSSSPPCRCSTSTPRRA